MQEFSVPLNSTSIRVNQTSVNLALRAKFIIDLTGNRFYKEIAS